MALKKTGIQLVAEGEAQFNAALKRAEGSVQSFGTSATKATEQVNAAAAKSQSTLTNLFGSSSVLGVGREQFARLGSTAAQAFNVIGVAAGQANSEIGRTIQSASQLATAFVFGGPIGGAVAGVALVIGKIMSDMQAAEAAATKATEALTSSFKAVREEIANLAVGTPFDNLARSIGIANTALREYIQSSKEAAESVTQFTRNQEKIVVAERNLSNAVAEYAKQLRILRDMEMVNRVSPGTYSEGFLRAQQIAVNAAATEVQKYSTEIRLAEFANRGLADGIRAGSVELDAQKARMDAGAQAAAKYEMALASLMDLSTAPLSTRETAEALRAADLQARWRKATDTINESMRKLDPTIPEDWAIITRDNFEKARQKAIELANAIKQIVESAAAKALTPTKVTEEDLKATEKGKYKPKWDEAARQLEDVMQTPENIGKYKGLAEMLKELGMSAEDAAAGFRDFSLFADPKNIKFADLGAITADMEHQLASLAGKANITKAAIDSFWSSLSPAGRANLAAAGIGSADDAMKSLLNPTALATEKLAGMGTAIKTGVTEPADAATGAVTAIGTAVNAIPLTPTVIFDILKAEGFDTRYKEIAELIDAINDDITVHFNIVNEANIPGKQSGGPVVGGQAYIVGERGPELFVAPSTGTILPNVQAMAQPLSTYYQNAYSSAFNIAVNMTGSFGESDRMSLRGMGDAIAGQILARLESRRRLWG